MKQYRDLYGAIRDGDDTRVRELLAAGVPPDKYKDSEDDTALADAAYRGRDSIVSILIQHGAYIDRQNEDGWTALHKAVYHEHNDVTRTLIVAGADLNRQDNDGETALHKAAEEEENELTTTLIEAGADLNIQDKNGDTALHCAVWNGRNETTTTLIKAGADINIQNKEGVTPIQKAVERGHHKITSTLIKAGARVAKIKNKKVLQCLIDAGADLSIKDNDGNTALHWAAFERDSEVEAALMMAGADINIRNKKGETPLSIAAGRGNNKVLQSLIEAGADLNIQDNEGDTAFHSAAIERQSEVGAVLIKAGADLNIRNKKGETALKTTDEDGNILVHHAAEKGDSKDVTTLIEAGAELNIQNKNGFSPLIIAAEKGNNNVVHSLVQAGADLNIQNKDGDTALHRAAQEGLYQVTTTLIEAGADIKIRNKKGETAMKTTDRDGNTLMHHSAAKGDSEEIKTLIEAGADLNIRNNAGKTALHSAASKRRNDVLTTLIKAGSDLKIKDNDGNTALENAAKKGYCDVVTTWIESGAEVPLSLASMMMNKEPSRISSVLDFLSKKLEKLEDQEDNYNYLFQLLVEKLGIEVIKGEQKMMFYNVSCKYLDDKSLLEYIDSENVRLSRQREELIDLSVKIANLNNTEYDYDEDYVDTEKAMGEVINHYKSGLPSGVGLRDMIKMIQDRYPWSSSKKKIMIFVSLVTCLLGIGLYLFDLTTDVDFSLEMWRKRNQTSNNTGEFDSFLIFPSLKSNYPQCFDDMNSAFNKKYDRTTGFDDFLSNNYDDFSSLKSDHAICFEDLNSAFKEKSNKQHNTEDYGLTALISIWHCIQPFVVTVVVFIAINYKNFNKGCPELRFSLPDIPDVPDCLEDSRVCEKLNCLLCCIPFRVLWPLGYLGYRLLKGMAAAFLIVSRSVPIPAFTNIFQFYLDVRSHRIRSEPDFRTVIVNVEEEIRDHEALGKFLNLFR